MRHGEGENTGDERCRRTGLCRADGDPWLLPGTRLLLTRGCSESPRRVSSRWMNGPTRGASSSVRRASTSALARTCAIRALPRSGGSIATSLPCSRSGRRSSPPSGGATVGDVFGCALSADDPAERAGSRLTANFARLGSHHGLGISVTLPAVFGTRPAVDQLCGGRSIAGSQALQIGLCDRVTDGDVRAPALKRALEIGSSAPRSLAAIRANMRRRRVVEVHAAREAEADARAGLPSTAHFREGVSASIERRTPNFGGASSHHGCAPRRQRPLASTHA